MKTKEQDLKEHRQAILDGKLIPHLKKLGYKIQADADYRTMCLTWGQFSDADLEGAGLTAENGYGLRRESQSKSVKYIEVTDLAKIGKANITGVGDENIYFEKDGNPYYSKVMATERFVVGPVKFNEILSPLENGVKFSVPAIREVLDTVSAQHVKVIEDSLNGIQFQFNDRSAGIFADGYKDRDGLPVGDTFAYRLRAQLNGAVARDWTKEQNAALVASYSSAEMNEIMNGVDTAVAMAEEHSTSYNYEPTMADFRCTDGEVMNGVEKTITEGTKLTDVLTANLGRSDTWREHDNLAMRYMEECDLIGGEADCHPSMANALPHEMTFAEFAKIARVEKLENHGRQSEVFIGDKSLGFCDFPGGDDALRQAHAREINNAIYVNAPEAAHFMEKVSFPPAHVLAEYPELMEVWADVLKGREPEVHSKAWFDACFKGDTPPQDLRDFSESFVKKYGIKGICDPMYIVNVTAFELGCGDGRGKFTEGRECPPEKLNRVADRLLFSYSANIQNTSLLTTQEDVTGLLKSVIEAGRSAQEFVSTGIHCGAITKNEDGVVTQKVGRAPGDVVQHDCARLIVGKDPAVMLAVGKVVDIRYSNGVGVVMPQLEIDR